MIVIPYAVYAIKINTYGQVHKPEGYVFPCYSQLWITALSTFVIHMSKLSMKMLRPWVLGYVRTHNEDTGMALKF